MNTSACTHFVIESVFKKMEFERYFAHLNADSLIKCCIHDLFLFYLFDYLNRLNIFIRGDYKINW
jgi:hypothetical protein